MDKYINRLNKYFSNKGMTLVEVLVAIMILTILVVAFTNLIGWNFTNIFNTGEKSKAIATAMEKSDQLTALVKNAESKAEEIDALSNPDNGYVSSETLTSGTSQECVYTFTEVNDKDLDGTPVDGYEVIVVVFYENFKFNVKLDSFILSNVQDN